MGRRALKQPDPSLDLSVHLLSVDDLTSPWDPAAIFGRCAPLELEIGSGKGLFLSTAPVTNPDHDFLGIEIARKYARYTAAKLARLDITNARIIHGDARRITSGILPDESVWQVHIYFPDPWWKKRHVKRRIMTSSFLGNLQRVLSTGGVLHFWSDVKLYFEQSVDLILQETSLAGPIDVLPQTPAHDLDYRTHFERRMRLDDLPVYRAEFRKTESVIGKRWSGNSAARTHQ